ncbi:hypothetical protein [Dyadobacter sandarakinus]|uniref:ApeA N-terminal domain-containing protein n=1 Tax=Dyadobacter sandarakinus TaxID=2747268 RepID=A0ABX7I5X7_9BACT|nr:hypothetical protein [Dyadobacter sandarakinus]QRR01502.1 hypothetical protein HWI92_11595 [Dyadobacter sandarakinus]
MKIYLRGTFLLDLRDDASIEFCPFDSLTSKDGCKLSYYIETGSFEVKRSIDGDQKWIEYLQDKDVLLAKNSQHDSVIASLKSFMILFIEHIKYFFGVEEIDEFLSTKETFEWSIDQTSWQTIPDRRETMWVGTGKMYSVDGTFTSWIPWLLENNIRPFFAFHHLHKALSEDDTRHKWINATIAAELAFKEFLSTLDPKTSALIINVPSPPLKKLYKDVLKEYTGFESPMANALEKGSATRNSLVHKTNFARPGLYDTNVYVAQVQVAIFHLYTCLYPDNDFFLGLLNDADSKLAQIIWEKRAFTS